MEECTVKVRVPGTTANCGPGFDAIGIACTIYNEIEVTLREEDRLTIEIYGEGRQNIPCDDRNVVWQSMRMLLDKAGASHRGARIKMVNHIPLSRGLGSSAAAIVGGLAAANAAIGDVFDRQAIFEMATAIEGHPDNVAPALFGGVTLSIVKDGRPQCMSFVPDVDLKMVVAVPEFSLSTKAARKALPMHVPLRDAVFNVGRAALLAGALIKGELNHLRYALEDKLHQPYRSDLIPGMRDVFQAANAAGALGTVLSGAGPCLIAFAADRTQEIGKAMTAAFRHRGVLAKYIVLDVDARGARVIAQ